MNTLLLGLICAASWGVCVLSAVMLIRIERDMREDDD